MVMNSKLYDFLKMCGKRYLPALVVFILAVGQIWNIPHTEEIGATITAFTLFLNECLGVSKKKYVAFQEAHYEPEVVEEEQDA